MISHRIGIATLLLWCINLTYIIASSEHLSKNINYLNLVCIVDESSTLSALMQLFSVVMNMAQPERLHVHYLLFPHYHKTSKQMNHNDTIDDGLSVHAGNVSFNFVKSDPNDEDFTGLFLSQVRTLFPNIKVSSAIWSPPSSMQYLRNHRFEQQHIFARFYLPQIFPLMDTFVYLDNDVIMNSDFESLATIITKTVVVSATTAVSSPTATSHRSDYIKSSASHHHHFTHPHKVPLLPVDRVVIAMHTESHGHYRAYLLNHFNQTHPLFLEAMGHLGDAKFLNAGVFVVQAKQWREGKYTERVEELMMENTMSGYQVYSTSVGDQGPFYLLFHNVMKQLPAEFNMRRLPTKTFLMLNHGARGVIHYASVTHGDALYLCRYPTLHEMLSRAATPLYLATLQSFARYICPKSMNKNNSNEKASFQSNKTDTIDSYCRNIVELCRPAAHALQEYLVTSSIHPHFHAGNAASTKWPLDERDWPALLL